MTKYEYLAELERLLAALPEQERRDAMNYYEEYFVSAGPEKEAEAIRELGTPQQAAQKILEEAGVAAAPAPEAPQAVPVTKKGMPAAAKVALAVAGALAAVVLLAVLLGGALFANIAPAQSSVQGIAQNDPSATATPQAPAVQSTAPPAASAESGAPATAQAPVSGQTVTGTAGEWQVTLGSGLYKFDLELGCGDLQVVLDPNAAQSTLLVQGLDQSQYQSREEDFGEIKVVLGSRARQQSDQRFTATLTVPDDGALQELDLSLNAGSITLPDLTLDELDVELNAGDVTAGNVTARNISVETNAGNFTAAALNGDEVSLETNAGSIEAAQVQPGRELEVSTHAGNLTVALTGTSADYNLEAEGRAGTLTYDGAVYSGLTNTFRLGSGPVHIETEVAAGQITVSFLG